MKAVKFYLDDEVHQKLKKILKSRGQTFSWWIRDKMVEEIKRVLNKEE